MTKRPNVVPLLTLESRIKRELRDHLRRLGFIKAKNGGLLPPNITKETLRALHGSQRLDLLSRERTFIEDRSNALLRHFANGSDIQPGNIRPILELISSGTWQAELFRFAALTWSVPVSQGYGRRMRFLIWDESNAKLIGLLALGDPVFNLRVRDRMIGWTADDRRTRLVNILDAYVLGAVPPYSFLLGGKLVACLVRTAEVRDAFSSRYGATTGLISQQRKNAQLAMVTTSSALGRSSLYNRLRIDGRDYFRSIGFTSGWGHFHVPDRLFNMMRTYLRQQNDNYASNHEFGEGPNWRLRAIRKAMRRLGLNPHILHHGISREVFACEIASNAAEFLRGRADSATYETLETVEVVGRRATARWIAPRASRDSRYASWTRDRILTFLDVNSTPFARAIGPRGPR